MDSDNIIARLKFIGKIKAGEKVHVQRMMIQPDTFFSRVSRTILSPDNRENAIIFIESVVDKSFALIGSSNEPKRITLINDLKTAVIGIQNLMETYESDHFFASRLECVIQNIQVKITEYDSAVPSDDS